MLMRFLSIISTWKYNLSSAHMLVSPCIRAVRLYEVYLLIDGANLYQYNNLTPEIKSDKCVPPCVTISVSHDVVIYGFMDLRRLLYCVLSFGGS